MKKFINKHRAILSFLAGVLLTCGVFWWFTPALSTNLDSIRSFDDCSLAGFTTFQNADNEMTCVLPNKKFFTHRMV